MKKTEFKKPVWSSSRKPHQFTLTVQRPAPDETIRATLEHPFAVQEEDGTLRWVAAQDLKTGMRVVTIDGSTREIVSTKPVKERHDVYNMTVETDHTYFVGQNAVWVHNQSGPPRARNNHLPQRGHVRGPYPSAVNPGPSLTRSAIASEAIAYVRQQTGLPNSVSIVYVDEYASLHNTLGVMRSNTRNNTFNGMAVPIDAVTQNNGTAVTIFRSAVEPTVDFRAYRELDANGNVNLVNTNDRLTGKENAIRVLGHEVLGHVQGGLGTSQAHEARADQFGEQLLQRYRRGR